MDNIFQNYINGVWCDIRPGASIDLADPASGLFRHKVPLGGEQDVDLAAASAHQAFKAGWSRTDLSLRLAALENLIEQIEANHETFAQTISEEIGAPIDFSRSHQVDAGLNHLRATLTAAEAHKSEFDQPASPSQPDHRVRYEPIGVSALISPWNWPLNQIALKVGAALVAGCTMVLKPSELAPKTSMLFADCMAATGLPNGVFNMLIGGSETGELLSAHRLVDVVSFTGSTRAGRSVAKAAAGHFKHTTLELGGKSPNLVFADCHLDTAMKQGIAHCFRNSGQSCNAAARMLVEKTVYEDAVNLAADIARDYQTGMPSEPGPHLGPLINRQQYERVQDYITSGLLQGARLVAGGPERPSGASNGYFVKPTVFADVTSHMTIYREEIFGPVLTISPFENLEEAVQMANDTEYGLAAYVQTGSPETADIVSQRVHAGMIQVNGTSRAPGAPFGGVKSSGTGREAGLWGIRSFQNIKSISGAERVK